MSHGKTIIYMYIGTEYFLKRKKYKMSQMNGYFMCNKISKKRKRGKTQPIRLKLFELSNLRISNFNHIIDNIEYHKK